MPTLRLKDGREIELPSPEENAAIEAAAATDPDAPILSDEEWQAALHRTRRGGRPRSEHPKIHTGIRLSPEVLAYFRATGRGWQTRMNQALKEWIAAQK